MMADRIGLTFLTIITSHLAMSSNQTATQRKLLNNHVTKAILVFSVAYISMSNYTQLAIPLALLLGVGYVVLTKYILNENSRFSIIPEWWVEKL